MTAGREQPRPVSHMTCRVDRSNFSFPAPGRLLAVGVAANTEPPRTRAWSPKRSLATAAAGGLMRSSAAIAAVRQRIAAEHLKTPPLMWTRRWSPRSRQSAATARFDPNADHSKRRIPTVRARRRSSAMSNRPMPRCCQ